MPSAGVRREDQERPALGQGPGGRGTDVRRMKKPIHASYSGGPRAPGGRSRAPGVSVCDYAIRSSLAVRS